jgi:hypothetical protein
MEVPRPRDCVAYGAAAAARLRVLAPRLPAREVRACATRLQAALAAIDGTLFAHLTDAELGALQRGLARHLSTLLEPALEAGAHAAAARRIGRAHALCGLDLGRLVEGCGIYQEHLHRLLQELAIPHEAQARLLHVIDRRLLHDLQAQVEAYREVEADTARARTRLRATAGAAASAQELLQAAGACSEALDGCLAALWLQAGDAQTLRVVASFGDAAQRYRASMEDGTIPPMSRDPSKPEGNGLGGRAWRAASIEVTDAWALEAAQSPWRDVGSELGFRSSAGIALAAADGSTRALFSLYSSWPGFFSAPRVRDFLVEAQQILAAALTRLGAG